jgi:hypothetical protein
VIKYEVEEGCSGCKRGGRGVDAFLEEGRSLRERGGVRANVLEEHDLRKENVEKGIHRRKNEWK